ncbi:hypothetical protein PoB_004844400 [Plakobranchus ocellatus]|uniref:Uncharacterized protein n=1 Tax=Plakobranchus ocellatus TaxID=259542 RepID=A0AAV4BSZ8_9GAST|nr:hypothetical protein PoB_004844400 [Plakobranchus ocellatus]
MPIRTIQRPGRTTQNEKPHKEVLRSQPWSSQPNASRWVSGERSKPSWPRKVSQWQRYPMQVPGKVFQQTKMPNQEDLSVAHDLMPKYTVAQEESFRLNLSTPNDNL